MVDVFRPTTLDLLLIFGISVTVAVVSWRNRPQPGAYPLTGFMLAVAVWVFAHFLAHVTPATLFFRRLRWLGIGSAAFVWFVFVLVYVGREDLVTRRNLGLLAVWPLVLNALIWLPGATRALGVDPGVDVWTGLYEGSSGLFWTHIGLSYGLFAVGSALLLSFVRRNHPVFRRQGHAVLLGIGALWAGSFVTIFELFGDLHVHFAPAGLTVMGLAFLWATTRGRLTDLVPVATPAVLETMEAGVLVVDSRGRVVDINPAARSLFGVSGSAEVVGSPLGDLLATVPSDGAVRRAFAADAPDGPGTVELGDSIVQVTASDVRTGREQVVGRVYVLNDVTEQRRRQAELQRQKDRLDEFASIISHDIRNPLTIASGRLSLAREEPDPEHLDAIEDALDRIETIIDETLTLARQGRTVDPSTIEPVPLGEVATDSWRAVETDRADLQVDRDVDVEADRERLRHVFENLFRNAIQHSEDPVTVRVGTLDDDRGLFVEDDGPGIPADERERVFESGFSTENAGGLGLTIVRDVVEAHGWEVRVADGIDAGTRFEILGVDVARPDAAPDAG